MVCSDDDDDDDEEEEEESDDDEEEECGEDEEEEGMSFGDEARCVFLFPEYQLGFKFLFALRRCQGCKNRSHSFPGWTS